MGMVVILTMARNRLKKKKKKKKNASIPSKEGPMWNLVEIVMRFHRRRLKITRFYMFI